MVDSFTAYVGPDASGDPYSLRVVRDTTETVELSVPMIRNMHEAVGALRANGWDEVSDWSHYDDGTWYAAVSPIPWGGHDA